MKNVTGTSSAVAIVAVSPGTAPTNRPNSDAPSITHSVFGSKTRANAASSGSIAAGRQNAWFFSTPQGSGTRSSL